MTTSRQFCYLAIDAMIETHLTSLLYGKIHRVLTTNIHIFTSFKQPRVVLPETTLAVSDCCECSSYWPQPSLDHGQKIREASTS